jgi:Asp-tRNA(Asn)/Glu-tRNA(Gln) amidotransferase A subunit family amidase
MEDFELLMTIPELSPLEALRRAVAADPGALREIAQQSIGRANGSASRNTYVHLDPQQVLADADALEGESGSRPKLFGVPFSLKDCFDRAATVTTAGSRFYAAHNPPAQQDSAMVRVLRKAGALIIGKTHLHQLAYGITGQNADYADCLQPRDATLLTGGSSSGAAASVQEGSALAAIGTDTGGSIRVPAALCGLVGLRASHSVAYGPGPWPAAPEGLWAGGIHLARTFDTPGFFVRDPRDVAPIADALFGMTPAASPEPLRIGFVDESFFHDASPEVRAGFSAWRGRLEAGVAQAETFSPTFWAEAQEIFGPVQAAEAASVHAGHFDAFEPAIAARLKWGAAFRDAEIAGFRERLVRFRASMQELFARLDLLVVPCAPVNRLVAAEDQSQARTAILRYTTPFSLSGSSVLSLPGEILGAPFGTGVQVAAAPGRDGVLLEFAACLGNALASGT